MQLKIKWVEINQQNLLSPHMPLQPSPWSLQDEWRNILVWRLVVLQEGFENGMQKPKLET
jgi:hypothetical protein